MAHKVYRWVDPQGRPTTPPPDPYAVTDQMGRGPLTEADERRVKKCWSFYVLMSTLLKGCDGSVNTVTLLHCTHILCCNVTTL